MRKFLYHGLLTALISSVVVALYLYSIYNFVPKGSPDPLVGIDSPMRKELTTIKMIGIYMLLSLLASLLLAATNRFVGKWGIWIECPNKRLFDFRVLCCIVLFA